MIIHTTEEVDEGIVAAIGERLKDLAARAQDPTNLFHGRIGRCPKTGAAILSGDDAWNDSVFAAIIEAAMKEPFTS
jgi:hypothetical protein